MDNNGGPVTQAQLKAALDDFKQELQNEFVNLAARLERAETTLLTEFRNHARLNETRAAAIEVRTTGLESRLHELEQRMSGLSERVFTLEGHGQK